MLKRQFERRVGAGAAEKAEGEEEEEEEGGGCANIITSEAASPTEDTRNLSMIGRLSFLPFLSVSPIVECWTSGGEGGTSDWACVGDLSVVICATTADRLFRSSTLELEAQRARKTTSSGELRSFICLSVKLTKWKCFL